MYSPGEKERGSGMTHPDDDRFVANRRQPNPLFRGAGSVLARLFISLSDQEERSLLPSGSVGLALSQDIVEELALPEVPRVLLHALTEVRHLEPASLGFAVTSLLIRHSSRRDFHVSIHITVDVLHSPWPEDTVHSPVRESGTCTEGSTLDDCSRETTHHSSTLLTLRDGWRHVLLALGLTCRGWSTASCWFPCRALLLLTTTEHLEQTTGGGS